jgi:hypothetical protein
MDRLPTIRSREDMQMVDLGGACPFEAKLRASQCTSWMGKSAGMPPCVTAWLATRLSETPATIHPLFAGQTRAA